MDKPPSNRLRLSLERPYKADTGQPIPRLYDILPDGQFVFGPQESAADQLRERLGRIFIERGLDFFDQRSSRWPSEKAAADVDKGDQASQADGTNQDNEKDGSSVMTTEELHKMRMEVLPRLFDACGEMSLAKDLLASLLATEHDEVTVSAKLSATSVNKPSSISSVQAFNAQLSIGGKDEGLRKAAAIFKTASASLERTRIRGEKYWLDGLRIRKGNWGLIPAPLPSGSVVGKGSDRSSKDFLISYGLEESPASFRSRAIGYIAAVDSPTNNLVLPYRPRARLCVTMITDNLSGVRVQCHNNHSVINESTLDGVLTAAQREVLEQEIFSLLVNEAGRLQTVSGRVSERLVVLDAAPGVELTFELVVDVDAAASISEDHYGSAECDLIYHCLHILLLHRHSRMKQARLYQINHRQPAHETAPVILQPVIDILQYQVFCQRILFEVGRLSQALRLVGVPVGVSCTSVGQTGPELVRLFSHIDKRVIGGDVLIRVDNRHTIRMTFSSPSSLTAHLSQATITVYSVPQLCQLLRDEIERCLLRHICDIGQEFCNDLGGAWFVDFNCCVAKMEGCVLNFRVHFDEAFAVHCSAFMLGGRTCKEGQLYSYPTETGSPLLLMDWVEDLIKSTAASSTKLPHRR